MKHIEIEVMQLGNDNQSINGVGLNGKRVLESCRDDSKSKRRKHDNSTDTDVLNNIIVSSNSVECAELKLPLKSFKTENKSETQDVPNELHSMLFSRDLISPNECMKTISDSLLGFIPTFHSSLNMPSSFFPAITDLNIACYTTDLVRAICDSDITTLRSIAEQPESTLECCNRFGESILHLACRRGLFEVVKYMVNEANVSIRMRDDFGRTPLHDACWNHEPVWEIMDMLVRKDPVLLFLADKRGFTPFQYARKEHWHLWREFLYNKRECFLIHKDSMKKYLCS